MSKPFVIRNWGKFLGQIQKIGKFLVQDDIHDLGRFSYKGHASPLHHWQYGVILWSLSEYLTLLNLFFPFDKEIKKHQLEKRIKSLKKLQDKREIPEKIVKTKSRFQVYQS